MCKRPRRRLGAHPGACCPGARSSGGDGGVRVAAVLPCLVGMHVQVAVNSWQSCPRAYSVLRVTARWSDSSASSASLRGGQTRPHRPRAPKHTCSIFPLSPRSQGFTRSSSAPMLPAHRAGHVLRPGLRAGQLRWERACADGYVRPRGCFRVWCPCSRRVGALAGGGNSLPRGNPEASGTGKVKRASAFA